MRLSDVVPNLTSYILANKGAFPKVLARIVLFGSYARGTARLGSDVDIALVADSPWEHVDRSEIRDVFDEYNPTVSCSLFYTTTDKLEATNDKFDANYWIRKEGILLWER